MRNRKFTEEVNARAAAPGNRLTETTTVAAEPATPRSRTAGLMVKSTAIAAIALLGAAILTAPAHASCGSSVRVSAADSDCLSENHTDGSYTATNHCVHEIKIKIDVKGGSDSDRTISAAGQRFVSCAPPNEAGEVRCREAINPEVADNVVILSVIVRGFTSTSWGKRIRAVTCCSDHATCDRRSSDRYPN